MTGTKMGLNVTVSCEIKLFQNYFSLYRNNFISARGNLPEISSEIFWKLIAAHEYFLMCSMILK